MNYRVIQDYAIMSVLFQLRRQIMNEVRLQTCAPAHMDAHRHLQVVISRSLGVLLEKGAVVAIFLAAVSPTQTQRRRGAKSRKKTREQQCK